MAKYTAEQVLGWVTMEMARKRAEARFGKIEGMQALWERIRTGLIPTCSLRWSHQLGEHGAPHPETEPRIITTEDWTAYRGALPPNLWRGEASITRRTHGYSSPAVHAKFFDIRCDPAALDVEFPPPGQAIQAHSANEALPQPDRRLRVADAALAVWAETFKKLYPDADQDFAWKSAQGFFPDKHVSRDRVRALVPRPQGRPKET